MTLNSISTEELTGGNVRGRTLFFGEYVDPIMLKFPYVYEPRMFGNTGPICSAGLPLFATTLVMKRLKPEIAQIMYQFGECPCDELLEPVEIRRDTLVRTHDWPLKPFQAEFSALEVFPLGRKGSGISVVRNEYPGVYIGGLAAHDPVITILRVMNSTQFNKNLIVSYFFQLDIQDKFNFDPRIRECILDLLRDNLVQGRWTHQIVQDELTGLGYPIDEELMSFTMNNRNARIYGAT